MSDLVATTALAPAHYKTGSQPSCAVLVMSCDAYRDLWRPFFNLFWRNWPDCPFPVFLGTNFGEHGDPRVAALKGGELEWSGRLRLCLEQIESKYVLLLLEDYFLNRPVSSGEILSLLRSLHALNGTVLRIYPRPGPHMPVAGTPGIGVLHPLAPYRVSAQPALWKRRALAALLSDQESIWEFEWNGTVRSKDSPDGFYSTYDQILSYRHVVERGRWFRSEARYFGQQDIGCDFSARSVMSPFQAVKKALNRRRKNVVNAVLPLRWQIRT